MLISSRLASEGLRARLAKYNRAAKTNEIAGIVTQPNSGLRRRRRTAKFKGPTASKNVHSQLSSQSKLGKR